MLNKLRRKSSRIISNNPALDDDDEPMHGKGSSTSLSKGSSSSRGFDRQSNPYSTTSSNSGRSSSSSSRKSTNTRSSNNTNNRQRSSSLGKQLSSHARTAPPSKNLRSSKGSSISWGGRTTETETDITQDNTTWNNKTPDCSDPSLVSDDDDLPNNNHQYNTTKGGKQRELEASGLYSRRSTDGTSKNSSNEDYTTNTTNSSGSGYQTNDESTSIGLNSSGTTQQSGLTSSRGEGSRSVGPLTDNESGSVDDGDDSYSEESGIIFSSDVSKYTSNMQRGMDDSKASYPSMGDNIKSLRGGGKNHKNQQLQQNQNVRPPPRSMNSSSASVGEHSRSRSSSAATSDKQRRSNSNPSTGSRQRSRSGGPASQSRMSKSVSGNTINTQNSNSNNGEESMKLKPPSMKGMPYSQRSGISKKLAKNKPKKSSTNNAEYDTSSASSPMYHSNAATTSDNNGFNTSNQSITDSQRSGYESEQSETEVAAMQQLAYLVVSLRSELKEVNDSKDNLQSKLDTIEASNGGSINVDTKVQQLQQDKVDLQADIDAFIAEQDDLKSEINELTLEKSSLNDMISRLKNPNSLSHSQSVGSFGNNSSNRSLGSKGKKSYEELQERITDITDENHKLEKEIQLLVNEKSQLVSTRNDRADEIGMLEKQLEDVKDLHDKEMKEKEMNIKSMEEKIQELESSFDIVEKESKESKMTIAVLEDELSAKNDELSKVQEDHTKVMDGEGKKMTLLRSRLTQIEKQKGELQDVNTSLEKKLDDIKNEQSSSNITAKQADETVELQKKITSLEEEKTTLEKELEDKDTELTALEGKLKDQQEASTLSSEEKGQVKYLKERITNLATENDGLKTELSTLQSQLTALEKDTTSTRKTDENLKVKQEEYEELVAAKAKLESQHQESLDTITNLQKMVTSLEGTNTELEEEMNEATEAISMLEDELDRKDASAKLDLTKLTLLQQEISTANNEKTALVERNAKLSTTNDDLQTQIKVLNIEKKLAYEEAETLKLQKNIADEDQEEALLSRQEQKQEVDLLEDKMEAMREKNSEQLVELEQQVYQLEESKSKLEVELEESSDAITVLREALTEMEEDKQEKDEQIKNLKTKFDDKEVTQKEHQVNVDTIATLQKMITSLESSKVDLEEELNTSSEELHDLRNRLKNKNTLKEVTDLEEKVAKYTDENKSLTKRIKELTEANDKMKCEVKDLGESLASVTASRVQSEDDKVSSGDLDLASCDALLSELKNQIKQIVSSRNEALHEVEVLREEASVVSSPSEAGKLPPSPAVEVKHAAKQPPLDDSAKTDAEHGDCDKTYKTHEKSVGTAPSKASSRGSSLLEAAKKLCDNLDKKKSQESNKSRNNSPIQAAATSKPEKPKVDKSKVKAVASRDEVQDIKNVVDQDDDVSSAKEIKEVDKTPADVKPSPPLTPEEEKQRGNKSKLDIDQLTSIYFEKCGMSVSRFSDLSSDSSSFRRRAVKPPSDTITKKVKICRNGVFMGTYEGDLNPEGQRHGFGVLLCDNGNSYEGEWKKDKRDGLGIARYSSGDVYDGQWQRGKRQGHGVMYIEAGDTYIGSWNNGLKHGAGTYHWADGEVDVSWYQEDRRVGEGVRWNASRAKAFQLIRGTKKEELSLDEAYLRAEKLGLNLEKFDSQPGS